MIQSSFLDKITAVEVWKDHALPATDKAFIDRTLAMRNRTANQLRAWKEAFGHLQQSLPHIAHTVEQAIPRGRHYVIKAKETDTFSSHTFSPSYALAFICESEQDLHRETVDRLVVHFNETYLLKMDVMRLLCELEPEFDAQAFASLLLSCTDGLSPYDVGAENLRGEFAQTFRYASFSCKGKRLIIGNATYIEKSLAHDRPRLLWNDTKMPTLCRALTFFEHGATVNHSFWDSKLREWQNYVDVKNPSVVEEPPRIDSIRFYRNGRVDIGFVSEGAANAFMREFPVLEDDC